MKKSIILVISLLFILSVSSLAIAEEGPEAVLESASNSDKKGSDVWFSAWNLNFGNKTLEEEWQDPNHSYFGMSFTLPYAKSSAPDKLPPVFVETGFYRSSESDKNTVDHFYSHELELGLKHIVNLNRVNLYLGGGLSIIYAHSDTSNPTSKVNGYDYGAGYWVDAGIDYLFKGRETRVSVGVFVKISDVYLSDFDVNGGGYYYGIKIGIPFIGPVDHGDAVPFPSV